MHIKVINPNTSESMTKQINKTATKIARKDTNITTVNSSIGPPSIESNYDDHFGAIGVLEQMKNSDESIDAFIIACFGDPGLQAARELTTCPVLGIAESSLYLASILAPRYSVITALSRDKVNVENLIYSYGMKQKLASVRATPLSVLEFNNNEELAMNALKKSSKEAMVQDGAEALILGCAGMTEFSNELEVELGIPVIDGVEAAVKLAEGLIDMKKQTSKLNSYKSPESKQILGLQRLFN